MPAESSASGRRASGSRASASGSRASASGSRASKSVSASGKRAGKGGRATGRSGGDRRELRRSNDFLTRVIWVGLLVLGIAGLILALSWPSIQRSLILGQLDEEGITLQEEQAVMDEFLAYIAEDPDRSTYVRSAVVNDRGSIAAQIYLAAAAEDPHSLLSIAYRPDTRTPTSAADADSEETPETEDAEQTASRQNVSHDDRAEALEQAIVILAEDRDTIDDLIIQSTRLENWIKQTDWPDSHRDLAIATVKLIGITGRQIGGSDPAKLFNDLIQDAPTDPYLVDVALDAIAQVTNRQNIGYALALLKGPNADKVLAHNRQVRSLASRTGNLIDHMTMNVQPDILEELLAMLDHPNATVQATAVALLKGDGLSTISPEQQEDVGKRIAAYLTPAVREEKPAVFSQALESATHLRLVGARQAFIDLLPIVSPEHDDATVLARALGQRFIQKGDEHAEANEEILSALAEAIANDAGRTTAAIALAKVDLRGSIALRRALEACIANAEHADCMNAAVHIVQDLYGRNDVTDKLGRDPAVWRDFIAQDQPNFDHYADVRKWYEAEKHKQRTTVPAEELRANLQRAQKEVELLNNWTAAPLGIEQHEFERFLKELGAFKYGTMKAMH